MSAPLKLTSLPELLLEPSTGKFYYINGYGEFAEFVIPQTSQNGYKEYVAIVTQSSTNNPVPIVQHNDFDEEPTWTYDAVGSYLITLTGEFIDGKTVNWTSQSYANVGKEITYIYYNDVDSLYVETIDDGLNSNGVLRRTTVVIRVYN